MRDNSAYENELLKQIKNIEIGLKYYMQKNKDLENELNYYKDAYENQDIKTLNPEEVYFKDGTELVYKLMYDKINEIAMRLNKINKNIKDKE